MYVERAGCECLEQGIAVTETFHSSFPAQT